MNMRSIEVNELNNNDRSYVLVTADVEESHREGHDEPHLPVVRASDESDEQRHPEQCDKNFATCRLINHINLLFILLL